MAAYVLTVQGVNLTRQAPVESIRVSETGPDSNSTMEFDIEYPTGGTGATAPFNNLSQDVILADSTGRRFFKGNLVNVRLNHFSATGVSIHCTCLGYNAWLDRLVIPSYTSKRANGTQITSEREMVQSVAVALAATPPGNFAFDALAGNISNGNTNMDLVKVDGGSVQDVLNAIADAASTTAAPSVRKSYIDIDQHLRWFEASTGTGLTAPYLIGDANYSRVVSATSGIQTFWHMGESTGLAGYDPISSHVLVYTGGGIGTATLVANEGAQLARAFGGSAYAATSGAQVHLGDGPWSFECWFQRSAGGAAATLYSGGTTDVYIGFNASNQILIQKEGTGNHFVSDNTVTTGAIYHLVVTRTGAAVTAVYLNGVAMTGTTTARTFAQAAGNMNIGRKVSTTDTFFLGNLSHVAVYNVAVTAATALAHYKDGRTIVAEDGFDFERDANSSGRHVYVKGVNAAGTGWVMDGTLSNYNQSFYLDAANSNTAAKKSAIGLSYLRSTAGVVVGGRATVIGYDGWRAMQRLTVDNNSLGINTTYEIRQIDTTFGAGNGVNTYDLYFGALPWSGTFDVQRKRRGNHLSQPQAV